MKQNLRIAILITLVTTVIFGLLYPLAVTGLAQLLFPNQANGSLISRNGQIVGSELLGQTFPSPGYFHARPSNAGTGYDAANSAGFNFAPTNHQLLDRIKADVQKLQAENPAPRFPSISSPVRVPVWTRKFRLQRPNFRFLAWHASVRWPRRTSARSLQSTRWGASSDSSGNLAFAVSISTSISTPPTPANSVASGIWSK
jgi:hypothetical protein